VSSLATAMPPSAAPIAGESGMPAVRLDQPKRHAPAASPIVVATRIAPKPIAAGQIPAEGLTVAAFGPQAAGTTIPIDLSRYANTITIATSPTHPATGAAGNPVSGGGGGISTPGTTAATHPVGTASAPNATNAGGSQSAAPSGPTAPAGGQGQAITTSQPVALTGATTQGDGEIRPMTLRPSAPTSAGRPVTREFASTSGPTSNNPPASTANHNFSIQQSVSNNPIIGAPVSVTVQSINNSPNFQKVVWDVTGAVQTEPYVNSLGSFKPQGQVIDQFGGLNQPAATPTDLFKSYWGNTPGTYTITATPTFTDGFQAPSQSVTVTVVAPTVNSFTVTSTPFAWMTNPPDTGFSVTNPITLAASVSVPDLGNPFTSAGTIGLIQKINYTETMTNANTGQHTFDTKGLVLDTLPTAKDPAGTDYLYVGSSTSIANKATSSFSVTDTPLAAYHAGTDPATGKFDTALNEKATITLEDHLVYQPSGGIWVNLSTANSIVMTGEESYNTTTQKWSDVVPSTPNITAPMPTNQDYNIVTWAGWFGNTTWSPSYPY